MSKYSWLFFDADGTLFDYDQGEETALQKTFHDLCLPFTPQVALAYQRINQQIWQEFEQGRISSVALRTVRFERLFAELGIAASAEQFSQRYLPNLARVSDLIVGAERLVKGLVGHYHLGLITNGLVEVQRPRLQGSAIAGCFEVVVISEEVEVSKPDLRYFQVALAKAGDPPHRQVLVIGDSLSSDIRGGFEAGLDTCWYNPTGKPPDLRWLPTYEIARLEDLWGILRGKNR